MGKVILVGHCEHDSGKIVDSLLRAGFKEFKSADSVDEAVGFLGKEDISLFVGNRVIGSDEKGGIALVDKVKGCDEGKDIPIMILSGFEETQKEAVEHGAVQGVGKAVIASDETINEFKKYVGR